MKSVMRIEKLRNRMIQLNDSDYDKLFNMYDDDKTGLLDFREVLCCLSILTRGSIEEKIDICFQLFDKDNKNYLTLNEYNNLLEILGRNMKMAFDEYH